MTPSKPVFPKRAEYGSPRGAGATCDPVTWEEAVGWLSSARYYWVATSRPDGRPHTRAMWGVWRETSFHFATSPETVTGRNLVHNDWAVVHPESAVDVVIVEGPVQPADRSSLGAVVAEYEEKYGWRMNPDDAGMPFYTVAAHTVVAWRAQDPRGSGARWRLTPGRAVP